VVKRWASADATTRHLAAAPEERIAMRRFRRSRRRGISAMIPMRRFRLFLLIYLVVGLLVAAQHHYFAHATNLSGFLSLILAVLLWPLVLLGVHIKI
jgi:hypothetical protein